MLYLLGGRMNHQTVVAMLFFIMLLATFSAADDAPAPSFHNSIGMTLVYIPAGQFRMGDLSMHFEDEKVREVTLTKAFFMARTEITQAQWQAVMGSTPSHFRGDQLPVENVSWHEAVAFCAALSTREGRTYRLPTEAEWEYACRAGSAADFHNGGSGASGEDTLKQVAWFGGTPKTWNGNSEGGTRPVAQLQPNAWGLYDMHGNVWEWCADVFAPYQVREHREDHKNQTRVWHTNDVTDPTGPAKGVSRVLRGGSWYDPPKFCRASKRHGRSPDTRLVDFGFRIVCDVGSPNGQADDDNR